jgi:hypothetical protein
VESRRFSKLRIGLFGILALFLFFIFCAALGSGGHTYTQSEIDGIIANATRWETDIF